MPKIKTVKPVQPVAKEPAAPVEAFLIDTTLPLKVNITRAQIEAMGFILRDYAINEVEIDELLLAKALEKALRVETTLKEKVDIIILDNPFKLKELC